MSPSPPPTPHPPASELTLDEARQALRAALQPLALPVQQLPLQEADGRVLAADLVSPLDVPAHDNAAMDGYAFAGSALREGEALQLPVMGQVLAGRPLPGNVPAGACVRIMTGAVLPAGTDTVVPQELVQQSGSDHITVPADVVRPGAHRRLRGEDLAAGSLALPAGRVLRPADLGLAASLGFTALPVRQRLRVALFSTGDEITEPGLPLPPGGVYDSNRATLAASLRRLGAEVLDMGQAGDDPQALAALLQRALQQADVVLTSGGVSMGDADHTRAVLARHGDVAFWRVAMRPGRPFAFGALHRDGGNGGARNGSGPWLLALPGNPVAALVVFHALVRDALLQLAGAAPQAPLTLQVPAAQALKKRPGRSEFQRGIVEAAAGGGWQVRALPEQGSGVLRSMSQANALIVLEHERGHVAAGEPVSVWLFDGLV